MQTMKMSSPILQTFSNMLQTSEPSGQENIAPTVYLLAIVSAIFFASSFSVFNKPTIINRNTYRKHGTGPFYVKFYLNLTCDVFRRAIPDTRMCCNGGHAFG